jgi:hypothetical protein
VTAFTERYASPVFHFKNVPKPTSDEKYKKIPNQNLCSQDFETVTVLRFQETKL